ncbi:MAG TPA: hypothetical protein PLM07_17410 [Candidatus Rifleibacterium sp.]|nr:hypothetical protein [Candidatus Rifleibacterium sp.]HPT47660.1 hypothetical protein [Candidatus Rifleibacterium sp.]
MRKGFRDTSPFIEFMLETILNTIKAKTTPQVAPQVAELLMKIDGEMSRQQLQSLLHLKDRFHFREAYLIPALAAGLIEMAVPDRPTSRLQKYRLTEKGRQSSTYAATYQSIRENKKKC